MVIFYFWGAKGAPISFSEIRFVWLHVRICNSYNMDARALAYLLHEGAKRPRAINELRLSVHVITGLLQFNDL